METTNATLNQIKEGQRHYGQLIADNTEDIENMHKTLLSIDSSLKRFVRIAAERNADERAWKRKKEMWSGIVWGSVISGVSQGWMLYNTKSKQEKEDEEVMDFDEADFNDDDDDTGGKQIDRNIERSGVKRVKLEKKNDKASDLTRILLNTAATTFLGTPLFSDDAKNGMSLAQKFTERCYPLTSVNEEGSEAEKRSHFYTLYAMDPDRRKRRCTEAALAQYDKWLEENPEVKLWSPEELERRTREAKQERKKEVDAKNQEVLDELRKKAKESKEKQKQEEKEQND